MPLLVQLRWDQNSKQVALLRSIVCLTQVRGCLTSEQSNQDSVL